MINELKRLADLLQAFFLPLLLCFLITPIGLSFWWAHLLVGIFVVLNLNKIASYYLFWFLLAVVLLFSTETRLSLEYFLISSALINYSLSDSWKNSSAKIKKLILAISFFFFFLIDYFGLGWVEKGSALMLLPVFLAIYFPLNKLDFKINNKSVAQASIYMFSFLAILFSNKRTTLFGFLASLKNLFSRKILLIFSLLVIVSSFLVKDNIANFYRKSIEHRTLIWQAYFKGFQDSPIFGHGYSTFTLDFPPYRIMTKDVIGAQDTEYVVHGHSQIFHSIFEWGVLGITLLILLLILLFKYFNNAFLPFLLVSLFNVSLQSFPQVFLMALMINPFETKEKIFYKLNPGLLQKTSKIILIIFASVLMSMSCIGHYFFDDDYLSKAIKFDPLHPLYYFSRGSDLLNKDIELSKHDLSRAVELAPGVGYMHAFYAASLLGTQDLDKAKIHINKAISQMGEDPYLLMLSSFINVEDQKLSAEHYDRAITLNPDLATYLSDPSYTADEFIGVKSSNPRIMSFFRRGKKIFLPLPFVELE